MDLIYRKAYTFHGPNGDEVKEGPVPADMVATVERFRTKLVEAVCGVPYTLFLSPRIPSP